MNNPDPLFLRALNKNKLSTPPIWYMRQAGRYMPEYRKVRKKFKNFLDMCKNPDVCCELAMQPINAFELDAAILFSDIFFFSFCKFSANIILTAVLPILSNKMNQ